MGQFIEKLEGQFSGELPPDGVVAAEKASSYWREKVSH